MKNQELLKLFHKDQKNFEYNVKQFEKEDKQFNQEFKKLQKRNALFSQKINSDIERYLK